MTTISEKKRWLSKRMANISDSPALDASCILEYVLKKTAAQLIADAHESLSAEQEAETDALVDERISGKPIAYLIHHKAFWTLDLLVTPDTLIPRPETECLVQWVLDNFNHTVLTVADLGTGSGAIALALADEKKQWIIHATDKSVAALEIAKKNAAKNAIPNVSFYSGNWFDALPQASYDIIISNPPYICDNDPHLKALTHEPNSALTAGADGLEDIKIIVNNSKSYLKSGGALVIEHGYNQSKQVCDYFDKVGYQDIIPHHDLSGNPRFVTGFLY